MNNVNISNPQNQGTLKCEKIMYAAEQEQNLPISVPSFALINSSTKLLCVMFKFQAVARVKCLVHQMAKVLDSAPMER